MNIYIYITTKRFYLVENSCALLHITQPWADSPPVAQTHRTRNRLRARTSVLLALLLHRLGMHHHCTPECKQLLGCSRLGAIHKRHSQCQHIKAYPHPVAYPHQASHLCFCCKALGMGGLMHTQSLSFPCRRNHWLLNSHTVPRIFRALANMKR
jgi:hypothetical protein